MVIGLRPDCSTPRAVTPARWPLSLEAVATQSGHEMPAFVPDGQSRQRVGGRLKLLACAACGSPNASPCSPSSSAQGRAQGLPFLLPLLESIWGRALLACRRLMIYTSENCRSRTLSFQSVGAAMSSIVMSIWVSWAPVRAGTWRSMIARTVWTSVSIAGP